MEAANPPLTTRRLHGSRPDLNLRGFFSLLPCLIPLLKNFIALSAIGGQPVFIGTIFSKIPV